MNDDMKLVIQALSVLALVVAVSVCAKYYTDKTLCQETAELYDNADWRFTMRMGCMIRHKDRWVSGESLRNNTYRLEKE